jgi:hypothetical protein
MAFTSSNVHFRRALSAKMSLVSWNRSIWASFMGKIKGAQSPLNPVTDVFGMSSLKPTGRPIEVLEDFASIQTTKLDCPVFYPLGGYGVTGREIGTGKGQRAKLGNISVELNTKMQVFNPIDHKMSKYSMNKPIVQRQLLMRSHDYLTDWFSRYFAFQPYPAFYEGSSDNLTDPTWGEGISKCSHMNAYYADTAGATKVTFSNTKATYEQSMATALATLTDTATDKMSVALIEQIVYFASHSHRIAKDTVNGESVYYIVMSDQDAKNLQRDSEWNDRMIYAAERSLARNPVFTGKVAGTIGGAVILIDDCMPAAYVAADSTGKYSNVRSTTGDANGVCYGTENAAGQPNYMDVPVDPGHIKGSILFGKSALALGKIDEIGFNEEKSNFGNYQEIAADCTFGFKRADIIDSDGFFGTAGDKRYENVSSLILFTHA